MFFSRGPNKVQDVYTLKDMYSSYIKDIDVDSPYYVSYNEYVDINSMFYKAIVKSMIDEGTRFKLPFALGELYILKVKKGPNSKLPINWEATVQTGHTVFNFNEHTAGFGYKFFWTKPYKVKNKFMYRLVLTRANKRGLAKVIKEKKQDYFER